MDGSKRIVQVQFDGERMQQIIEDRFKQIEGRLIAAEQASMERAQLRRALRTLAYRLRVSRWEDEAAAFVYDAFKGTRRVPRPRPVDPFAEETR